MKKNKPSDQPVYGLSAPCARMTRCAALLIAVVLSVPVFLVLSLVELVFL